MTEGSTQMNALIVVGVDGSPEAAEALEYAAADAARRGATLRVVSVAPVPEYWVVPIGVVPPRVAVPSWELQAAAREAAQSAVDTLAAARPDLIRSIEVEAVGVCGHPAAELVEQSRGAELLVLGHRGRGTVASVVLGSVGLSCVLQAQCPVTIVRPTNQTPRPAATAETSAM
jgi:nucleotide-binding universal stress UspA family protein